MVNKIEHYIILISQVKFSSLKGKHRSVILCLKINGCYDTFSQQFTSTKLDSLYQRLLCVKIKKKNLISKAAVLPLTWPPNFSIAIFYVSQLPLQIYTCVTHSPYDSTVLTNVYTHYLENRQLLPSAWPRLNHPHSQHLKQHFTDPPML